MSIISRSQFFFVATSSLLLSYFNICMASAEGELIYKQHCEKCHNNAQSGAPLISNNITWSKRLKKDYDTLVNHTLQGYRGMPAKGGSPKLSNKNAIAALDLMLDRVVRNIQLQQNQPTPVRAVKLISPESVAPTTPSPSITGAFQNQQKYHQPPPDDAIPNDKYGDDVRLGQKIFTQTFEYASRYVRNGLTCSNCHNDAGRKANAAPMWGAFGMYPAYRSKNDRNNSLEDRIQQCFRFSLNGFAPAIDSPEIRALVAYAHYLSTGAPIGINMPGRGFPQIPKTGVDASPSRGAESYHSKCSICHGGNGEGEKQEGGGYKVPPVWGMGSYNKGAGFYRNDLLAGFIKANMPPNRARSVSDQEALDLAAYINLQLRPWDPRKGVLKGLFD